VLTCLSPSESGTPADPRIEALTCAYPTLLRIRLSRPPERQGDRQVHRNPRRQPGRPRPVPQFDSRPRKSHPDCRRGTGSMHDKHRRTPTATRRMTATLNGNTRRLFWAMTISTSTLTSAVADQLFQRRGISTAPAGRLDFRTGDTYVKFSEALGELDCRGSRCFVYLG